MTERYDKIGIGYSNQRRPDHRIFQQLCRELDDSRSILNVGAGTGSYEPEHVQTFAVEPSFQMILQRRNKANVIQALAEILPFRDSMFDSILAILTIHHWNDLGRGLVECARATRDKVIILTWDPESPGFWLTREYFPELLEFDRSIFPTMEELRKYLGRIEVKNMLIPADCVDGFLGAYWRRPEAYLSEEIRSGMSSFSRIPVLDERLSQLRKDLASGLWYRAHGDLLARESSDLGYRLVTATVH